MSSHIPFSAGRARKAFRGADRAMLLEAQDAILALIESGASLQSVLEHIAREIDSVTGHHCAITLVDAEGGARRIAAAPNVTEAQRSTLERSLAAEFGALTCSEPIMSDNVRPLAQPAPQAQAMQCLPLRCRNGRELGAFVVFGAADGAPGDNEAFRILARLARIAIESHRSDNALRLANERFAALAASVPGVVYQRRVDASGEIRYTYISEGAKDLFGVTAEEILTDPKALFDTHGPSYRESFRQRLLEASRTMTIWDVEAEIISRDGTRKWTHAIARPTRQPDGAVLWDGIILDATRIARREQQLRAEKDQAELANRGKSEFIATMSHELRTPLNAIIGFSEVMQQELLGPLGNPMYQEYCRDILESGRHLLSIINDVLDISKVEAGRIQLNEDAVDLDIVIAAVVRLMRERAMAAGVAISAEIAEDLPPIKADERLIKQILSNLLSNAIKFTERGGSAVVRARIEAGAVVVTVEDTGIGMAPEDIPRAMERFGQIDNSLSRKFEGTGLGLPLVKAFTELHGGTFDLQSKPGAGTAAVVTLPPSRIVPPRRQA